MKLGLSSYSLYNALRKGEMDIVGFIDYAAELGSEHIEIVPLGFDLTEQPELIDRIRSQALAAGLEISNYAIGANFLTDHDDAYEAEIERVKSQVDIAARLGVKLMRHDVASSKDVSIGHFNRQLDRLAHACRTVARYAAAFGITTSVENHGYFIQHSDRVQALVEAVEEPNYKTTLDIGNFMCADENPVVAVRNNLPYASMIHIKDFYLRPAHADSPDGPGEGWFRTTGGNYLRGAIAGHGDLDLREVLRSIKQSGYDGYLSLEFEGMEDCRTGSRIGMANVRRIWSEV